LNRLRGLGAWLLAGAGLRRSFAVSLAVHALIFLVASIALRPRFVVPKPLDRIPVRFIALAAPEPAKVVREQEAPSRPREVIPDPLKPPPKKKPPPPKEVKKDPVRPVEKPKPRPELPKRGSADTTQVMRSELPRIGNLTGAMQIRVEGETLPYAYYLAIIQRKIASYWDPPGGLDRGVEAVVWFRIEKDGRVATNYVEEPSGITFFDTAALRALQRALPMPPLPAEYPGDHLIIHLRFVYSSAGRP